MSEATGQIKLEAGQVRAPGSQGTLRLDGSERVYIVDAGEVEIFLVPLRNGEVEGNRLHIFTASAGAVLFDVPKADDDGLALIASGIAAKIIDMPAREFGVLVRDHSQRDRLLVGVDAWVRGLSTAIMRPLQGFEPRSVLLEYGKTHHAPADSYLRGPIDPIWVEIDQGAVVYADLEHSVAAHPVRMPLAAQAFVRTLEASGIRCADTVTAWDEGWGREAIDALNRLLLRLYDRNRRRAAAHEQLALSQRREAEYRIANSAIAQLAAPLDEHSVESHPQLLAASGDPLFLACAAVSERLGFSITAPPRAGTIGAGRAAALDAIARHNGLRSRRIRLEPRWWISDVEPFLLFAEDDGKPVAVLPSGLRGHYDLFDPADRRTTRLDARAAAALRGEAHVFTVSFPGRSLAARDVGGNALRWSTSDVAAIIGFTIAGGILALAVPVAIRVIADELIPTDNLPKLIELAGALFLVATISGWLRYAVQIGAVRIEGRTGTRLQAAIMERLLSLPATFFRGYTAGDLAKRALAIQAIERAVTESVISSVMGGAFAVVSLALMFYYSIVLAFVALAVIVLLFGLTVLLGWLRIRCEREVTRVGGQISGLLLPLVSGIQKIRLAGAEERAFLQWARLQGRYEQYHLAAERYGALSKLTTTVFPLAATTVVFAVVAYVVYGGARWGAPDAMGLGDLLAFLAAFNQATAGIGGLASVALQLAALKPLLGFAAPILQARPEVELGKLDPGELSGAIDISHVSFRYRPELPPVLTDFSLSIAAGEHIAIVGPSGSGKSTLLRLLLGFAFPETGSITFDGRDLRQLDVRGLRRQYGVVLQGGRLMGGTLLENILGSNLHLDEDAAWRAAEEAGMADEIRAMPMGMRTRITEAGPTLSGGQIQRVLIARALLGRPRILLLDEATSALDNRTQAIITRTLAALTVTRVVIAHRLSTVRQARRIVVLHEGGVAEVGNYAELMAKAGLFRRLAERQLISTDAG